MIYDMINQDERPGYGYQLKKGATSLTEAWDANHHASHNHFMLGHITEWFYKDLVGIDSDPAGPGFKKIIIRPTPVGDLEVGRGELQVDPRADLRPLGSRRRPLPIARHDPRQHDGHGLHAGRRRRQGRPKAAATPQTARASVSSAANADRNVYAIESGSYTFESRL